MDKEKDKDKDKHKDKGKGKGKDIDIDIDFSELNIPYIERYLDIHKKQIIDSIMNRIFKDNPKKIKIIRDDYDRLVYSLWCGYQSQTLKNDPSVDFKDEYVEQIQETINKAFNVGRNYANEIAPDYKNKMTEINNKEDREK